MNKLLLLSLAVCLGAIGSRALHQTAEQTHSVIATDQEALRMGTNSLAANQAMLAAMRAEVGAKKKRLWESSRHQNISAELRAFLERDGVSPMPASSWAELRGNLGLGWESSPDFVLVKKAVVKGLEYSMFVSAIRPTDTTCDLLALSSGEQTALRAILAQTREDWARLHLKRNEPNGDILAQYTVSPPDPVVDQSVSNRFAAGLTDALGSERADLLLSKAWRQLRGNFGPSQTEVMTIRRTVLDGEPDVICEWRHGDEVWSSLPIRDARYNCRWMPALLPGGWKAFAEREGFALPKNFQKY